MFSFTAQAVDSRNPIALAFRCLYVVSDNGTIKPSAHVRVFRSGRAASVRAFVVL